MFEKKGLCLFPGKPHLSSFCCF